MAEPVDNYAIIAESNGLVNGLSGAMQVELFSAGNVRYSPQMWDLVKTKQADLTYFSSAEKLAKARAKGSVRGGWNMSKASVLSVGPNENVEHPYDLPIDNRPPVPKLRIGYALWAVNEEGNKMRVDYAAASVSRSQLTPFNENPLDMYTLNEGVYVKKNNDHVNALGNLVLLVLDFKVGRPVEDMYVLLVKRGAGIDFLGGTWTAPSSYTEPESRKSIDAQFLENHAKVQVEREAGIAPSEMQLIPAGFVAGNIETAMVYFGYTPLSKEEVMSRSIGSGIEQRATISVGEYNSFIAANRNNIESESRGALEGIFGAGKLIEKYVSHLARHKS